MQPYQKHLDASILRFKLSLAAAYWWSDCKHHHTLKFLVAVTLNGEVSWISPCYGDIFTVRDSGFLKSLDLFEIVMADCGFKIKSELMLRRRYLRFLQGQPKETQMITYDVSTTSKFANFRIFTEKATAWFKWFWIFSAELSLLELPLVDGMVIACFAFVNILTPLK